MSSLTYGNKRPETIKHIFNRGLECIKSEQGRIWRRGTCDGENESVAGLDTLFLEGGGAFWAGV